MYLLFYSVIKTILFIFIQLFRKLHFYIAYKTVRHIIVVYLTSSCINWAFFGAHECQKRLNLHKNELNTTFFCSTNPLKAPNRLKSLKLA
jgi:hypothetical protein